MLPRQRAKTRRIVCSREVPGGVTGQYLGRDVRAPSPSPPRDRILKCTKTEEFSSLNGKKGAEAGFRSRVGGRVYVKCTGWSGVECGWAEMTEIQKKQNPTSVDRSRPRGLLAGEAWFETKVCIRRENPCTQSMVRDQSVHSEREFMHAGHASCLHSCARSAGVGWGWEGG